MNIFYVCSDPHFRRLEGWDHGGDNLCHNPDGIVVSLALGDVC
jgi:hypothetical protein